MARPVLLASYFTAVVYAARVFNKSTEHGSQAVGLESDLVPGQLSPWTRSATTPGVPAVMPWNVSGRVERGPRISSRAPRMSVQDPAYFPNIPDDGQQVAASNVWMNLHGEASSPVGKEYNRNNVLMPGSVMLKSRAAVVPHPKKADRKYDLFPHCGGEDAYFIEDGSGVLGVADGVGGWGSKGVDPGIYSRQLMNFAAEEVRAGYLDPGEVMQRAHERTSAQGSSTACILAFSQEQQAGMSEATWKVKVANLGDSGFIHLRNGEVLFESSGWNEQQSHGWNHPYQLTAPGGRGDSPSLAQQYELQDVLPGDVFVLGSDGLFDNAFGQEIAHIVHQEEQKALGSDSFVESAAHELARNTALWANDPDRVTPRGVEAQRQFGHQKQFSQSFRGGKLDDITAVVVVVGAGKKLTATSEVYEDVNATRDLEGDVNGYGDVNDRRARRTWWTSEGDFRSSGDVVHGSQWRRTWKDVVGAGEKLTDTSEAYGRVVLGSRWSGTRTEAQGGWD